MGAVNCKIILQQHLHLSNSSATQNNNINEKKSVKKLAVNTPQTNLFQFTYYNDPHMCVCIYIV